MPRSSMHPRFCYRAAVLLAAAPLLWAQPGNPCALPKEVEARRAGATPYQFGNLSGVWFAQHSKFQCAIAAFESALRADPDSQEARYNLGLALLEDRQLPRARKEFESL